MPKAAKQPAPAPPRPERTDEQIQAEEQAALEEGIAELPPVDNAMDRSFRPSEEEGEDLTGEPREPTPARAKPPEGIQPQGEPVETQPTDKRPPEVESKPILSHEQKEDADFDKQLEAIQPRQGNERDQKGYTELKGLIKTVRTENNTLKRERIPTLEKEIEDLKKRVIPEEQIKHWKDIEHLFETRAVESLPRWNQFDQEIESISKAASDYLTKAGISENLLKVITDRGGVIGFSRSDKPAGKAWKNADGTPMTESQWFNEKVFNRLNDMQRAEFSALTSDAYRKQRAKQDAIEEAKKRAGEVIEEERGKALSSFNEGANKKLTELIGSYLPKLGLPTKPPEAIDENLPAEEKKQQQRIKDAWTRADKWITEHILDNTPEGRAELAFKAAFTDYVVDELSGKDKEIARLTKELEEATKTLTGIKEARSSSRLRSAPPAPAAVARPDYQKTDEEAVEEEFGRRR